MSVLQIIRAWKDEGYRSSLTEAERALLPENPAGLVELTDAELDGGASKPPYTNGTVGCHCATPCMCCTSKTGCPKS